MATFFNEELGAQKETLFGCTVRSINAQLGIEGEQSTVNVTVIQEEGQQFSLKTNAAITPTQGIRSITRVQIGVFDFVGIVQSWEEIEISIQGSGIFEVKLTDAIQILDDTQILFCGGNAWGDLQDPTLGNNKRTIFSNDNSGTSLYGGQLGAGEILVNNPSFVHKSQLPTVLDLSNNADNALFRNLVAGNIEILENQSKKQLGEPGLAGGGFGILPRFHPGQIIVVYPTLPDDCTDEGIRLNLIQQSIDEAIINFGSHQIQFDFEELKDLISSRAADGTEMDYRFNGETKSISEFISRLSGDFEFRWFLTSSIEDSVVTIKVNIIDDQNDDSASLDMDTLSSMHEDRIISRRRGFENRTGITVITNITGGQRQVLKEYDGSYLKPFWGFMPTQEYINNPNKFFLDTVTAVATVDPVTGETTEVPINETKLTPLSGPAFHMIGDPQNVLTETTEEEMNEALHRRLVGDIADETLKAIREYASEFYGVKFYIEIDPRDLAINGTPWIDRADFGWWERDVLPDDVNRQNAEFLEKLTTEDNRWVSFLKLPDLTQINPEFVSDNEFVAEWSQTLLLSGDIIINTNDEGNTDYYIKVVTERKSRFWIITIPRPLVGLVESLTSIRIADLSTSTLWLAQTDPRELYGPWTNVDDLEPSDWPQGKTRFLTDKNLTPWFFANRGDVHSEVMERLNNKAYGQVFHHHARQGEMNSGQLEVADLPKVNLGTAFGVSSNITNININFSTTGITTRYTIRFANLENSTVKKLRDEIEKLKEDERNREKPPGDRPDGVGQNLLGILPEPPESDDIPEEKNQDDLEEPITPPPDDDEEDPTAPDPIDINEDDRQLLFEKPEGGTGVIIGKSSSGPFYQVRRLNIRDINPSSFAGGLNISESWFLAEWSDVRNLSEPVSSPGYLADGTIVTVSIFSEVPGVFEVYLEHTPTVFAPPLS